jgi:uracil-DNA glycosylase family 4
LAADVGECRRCSALVAWREQVADEKRAAFRDQAVLGPRGARVRRSTSHRVILGLAPAAHGANRTGRVFTGDRSGDFLYRAMHRVGMANQPTSVSIDDGLTLDGAWVTAVVKCAPPGNKPLPEERVACHRFLERELQLLDNLRVVVCLGRSPMKRHAPSSV